MDSVVKANETSPKVELTIRFESLEIINYQVE